MSAVSNIFGALKWAIILAILAGIAFALYSFTKLDFSDVGENIAEAIWGTIAGVFTGFAKSAASTADKYNPVTEWRRNKAISGRKWYYLYLRS